MEHQDSNRSSPNSNVSSSSSSSPSPSSAASDRLLRRPILMQKSYSSGGSPDYSFTDTRVSKSHGGTYTPPSPCLEHHPDDTIKDDILTLCLDKFWSKFAERLDGELEKRIQSVMEQQQQRQEEQRRITTRSTTTATVVPSSPPEQSRLLEPEAQHNVMARLHELEIATSRLDYRLAMLEKMIPKPSPKVSEDLRKENFELRAKLADREQKARQLEQEHIEFFKRQTQNMIQMDQMRQKIAALEAELQKQQKHKVPRPQHQQQHHPWRKKSSIPPPPPANRLPTPRSSPSHSLQDDEEEDLSVREIDGYLVFNTHIDGELIHCRVKIPNTTASSTPITTSTISMQQRQQQYHQQQQQQQPNRRAMVPPLNNHNMRKKGLNPHAPEWKLSGK